MLEACATTVTICLDEVPIVQTAHTLKKWFMPRVCVKTVIIISIIKPEGIQITKSLKAPKNQLRARP